MSSRIFINHVIFILAFFSVVQNSQAQEKKVEKQIQLAMRMIGHEVLLNSNDSSSIVKPIERNGDTYIIRFGTAFEFLPNDLINTIDGVIRETIASRSYLVEVKDCESESVVHAYKVGNSPSKDVIPCGQRSYPNGCYFIQFTLLDRGELILNSESDAGQMTSSVSAGGGKWKYVLLFILAFVFVLVWLVFFRKKSMQKNQSNDGIVKIGAYSYDKKNMRLSIADKGIELSGKEAELLEVLHESVNTTVQRDEILKLVWGDEGDYVGRTLDVFISKLRKKLEEDPNVKIANIRGVGYRLMLGTE